LSQNIDDYKKKFEADGFVIIKNIVPLEQINYIYEAIFHLLQKYSPEITKKIEGDKPWLDLKFHNELGRLQESEPKKFSKLYDSLQTHSIIQKIGISEKILKITSELLKKSDEILPWINLSNTPTLFRMDEPKKNTHTLDWHQERVSYDQNENGTNGLVVWIPLQNVDEKKGTLDVCIGSNKAGHIEPTHSGTYGNIQSEKKFLSDDVIKKFKQVSVEMEMGDVLFVSMLAIHKSGNMDNASRFRLTVTTRIHNTYSNDFKPGRNRFIKST
jgi:ectoine hydroxylase-related dioxygenase (phytanoyl-CoA dioxygenase family)